MFGSSGLYQLAVEERLSYVKERASSVARQNTILAVGGFLAAGGYVLWSVDQAGVVADSLNYSAAAVFALSAVFLAIFFYQTTINPESYYTADRISWVGNVYIVLASAGMVLYGLVFIAAMTPDWVGWVSIGVSVLMLIGLLVIGGKDLPPQPYFLVTLTTGIIFLVEAGV